ncbi:cupredoxin domain-containing protein [Halopiger goleimassiliensis]|uniref:cupredoxin domain-containing protein n=1 Tax=Halopiger goleimassiliensis TaxID=1293048 RepID=UPI000677D26C|nr:plastocyanin/azurin family copper-binding protein [Halopiger goleimassiliensis]
MTDSLPRREALRLVGIAGLTTALAGCGGPGTESDDGDEPAADAWADVDAIALEATTDGWTGVEPELILDERNPTLVLEAGTEYELSWENGDGEDHNLGVYDADAEEDDSAMHDPLAETEILNEEGETATLSFEATTDLVEYMCDIHTSEMVGEIEVQESEDGDDEDGSGGDDEDSGDEAGGG